MPEIRIEQDEHDREFVRLYSLHKTAPGKIEQTFLTAVQIDTLGYLFGWYVLERVNLLMPEHPVVSLKVDTYDLQPV